MTFTTPHRELRKTSFDRLTRYWNDPAFAAECDAEAKRLNAASMAAMDRVINRERMRRQRERIELEHQEELERG